MALSAAPIESERLSLEPLREGHAAEMVDVLADAGLYEFTGGAAPSLDQLAERYRFQVAGPEGSDEIWLNWIMRYKAPGRAIGYVQATVVGEVGSLAWLVERDHQGSGFSAEAARAMAEWLTANGVTEFRAHIHPDHVASERVAQSIGLEDSGLMDEDGERIWSTS